jgi:protein gp37
MAGRLEAMGVEKYVGLTRKSGKRRIWTGKIFCDQKALDVPKAWKKPRKVFVNSMSDLFHEDVPVDFIRRVWAVMQNTPQHTYQIMTKRPQRMMEVLSTHEFCVLPNVWLGTSVEDRNVVGRIGDLRKVPAAIRFVSFEPLIGSVGRVNLSGVHWAIVGGESGPGARGIEPRWVDEIEAACRRYEAAFFFKQWGGVQKKRAGRTYRDREWDELPTTAAIA